MKKIKPNKNSFVYFYNVKIAGFSYFTSFSVLWGIPFVVLAVLIIFYNRLVRYEKEEYIFYKDKIVMISGNLISDKETELRIKNITHSSLNLPYIETKIFRTGNIFVDAAGSATTEIKLSHIDNPFDVFKEVQSLMIKNGFTLSKKELIQKEIPDTVAVFLDVMGKIILGIFIVYYTVITSVLSAFVLEPRQFIPFAFLLLLIASVIVLINVFRFMNLKRKKYYLYKDTIYYEDGFFTENYAYIPFENLSDTDLEQNFITKLLGLYNIRISSRGQGNDIRFFYIRNGETLNENLDLLINKEKKMTTKEGVSKKVGFEKKTGSSFKDHHFIDLNRSLFNVLVLAIFAFLIFTASTFIDFLPSTIILVASIFVLIISLVGNVIPVFATTYNIKNRSVESVYSFLTTKNLEFGTDNITALEVRENIFDKLYDTYTLVFYSIGSNQELVFRHIKKEKDLVDKLIKKLGIKRTSPSSFKPDFDFISMIRANLFLNIFLLVVISTSLIFINIIIMISLGFLFFVYVAVYFYKKYYYTKPVLNVYKDSIDYFEGVFFKKNFYAQYEDVKDIYSLRYPFGDNGTVDVNIAGEVMVDESKQVTKKVGFKADYYKDILDFHDYLDSYINKKSLDKKVELKAKPQAKNPLVSNTLLSIIIFPLILVLPFTWYITWLRAKRTSFFIEKDRLKMVKGILFRRKVTVLYQKINHINTNKGLLNKLLDNGNVTVFTTGSGSPELTIYNVEDYQRFYKGIEKKYKN